MAIQRRMRCSVCRAEWWEGRYSQPKHDCTPPPPETPAPANMECHSPHAKWGSWNYCPICGVALTTKGK